VAGNSKKRRKPGRPAATDIHQVVAKAKGARAGLHKKLMARNQRLAELPMGHPANAYVLDWTFGPLYKMFDDQEKTGTHLFDADGMAVLWVERDQCYTPVVEACMQLHEQFEFTAAERGWGAVPPGLLSYGVKLAAGLLLDAEDQQAARATVAWMREKLEGISCIDWAQSMLRMEALERQQQEPEAQPREQA
jgi:hypothetical protein